MSWFSNQFISRHSLETKKQLYEKIKFKKPLSVFKTDKIANLHGHEVLRSPVCHCELNPIELIWAQVKGFVVPVQSVIMLDWIQLFSSLDSSSSKSIIIGGISLLSMQFSFPYSFSIFTTSRLKKLLCQTLIREKLSYKIMFQNTTFPWN
jgi:hypothetical protein